MVEDTACKCIHGKSTAACTKAHPSVANLKVLLEDQQKTQKNDSPFKCFAKVAFEAAPTFDC